MTVPEGEADTGAAGMRTTVNALAAHHAPMPAVFLPRTCHV